MPSTSGTVNLETAAPLKGSDSAPVPNASAGSLTNPLLNGFYATLLAYRDGDPERPSLAAGAGLRLLLRALLAHRGALYYTRH